MWVTSGSSRLNGAGPICVAFSTRSRQRRPARRDAAPARPVTHSNGALNRVRAALAGADADRLVDRRDKDLAVADPAGVRGLLDRLDRALDQRFLHHDLDLHLRQEVDDIFGSAIELGMSLLATEPLGLGDGDALDADLVERLLHLVELEGLDDRLDLFHRILVSLNPKQRPRSSAKHILCHSFPRREMERLFPRSAQFLFIWPHPWSEDCREACGSARSPRQSPRGCWHRKSADSPRRTRRSSCPRPSPPRLPPTASLAMSERRTSCRSRWGKCRTRHQAWRSEIPAGH